jgi:CBS-domain-containing membrane protein
VRLLQLAACSSHIVGSAKSRSAVLRRTTTSLVPHRCVAAAVGGYVGIGVFPSQVLRALHTLRCAALLTVVLPQQHSWQVTCSACNVLVGPTVEHPPAVVPAACAVLFCAVVKQLYLRGDRVAAPCVLSVHMEGIWEALVLGNKQPLD